MSRKSINDYYLDMLSSIATRSTCPRRQVAAIITDADGLVLSMGFNGVPKKYPHCIDTPCPGARDLPGNTDNCMAIHAEQNALLNCVSLSRAHIIYCSNLPCFTCAKLIANTPIIQIWYIEDYADKRAFRVSPRLRFFGPRNVLSSNNESAAK